MALGEVDRRLTMEETDIIFQYVRNTKVMQIPFFGNINKNASSEPIMNEMPFDTSEGAGYTIKDETTEIATRTSNGWFANIISKTKNVIANLLMRKKVAGFYLQWAKADDGTDVFAWVNRHGKFDYVLRLNGKEVTECRALDNDAELDSLAFDKCNINQVYRAAFYLKHLLHETQRENEIYKAKLNAIAEILVMEDGKL